MISNLVANISKPKILILINGKMVEKGEWCSDAAFLCRFDLRTVPVDFVECLTRFIPTEAEVKLLRQYERDRKPLEALSDEDRFMMQFSRIERLSQRMTIMTFMGNYADNIQMLTPVRKPENTAEVQRKPETDRLCFLSATPRHHRRVGFHQIVSEAEEDPGGRCVWF